MFEKDKGGRDWEGRTKCQGRKGGEEKGGKEKGGGKKDRLGRYFLCLISPTTKCQPGPKRKQELTYFYAYGLLA